MKKEGDNGMKGSFENNRRGCAITLMVATSLMLISFPVSAVIFYAMREITTLVGGVHTSSLISSLTYIMTLGFAILIYAVIVLSSRIKKLEQVLRDKDNAEQP